MFALSVRPVPEVPQSGSGPGPPSSRTLRGLLTGEREVTHCRSDVLLVLMDVLQVQKQHLCPHGTRHQ